MCCSCTAKRVCFSPSNVDDIKINGGERRKIWNHVDILMKQVGLEEPTSLLDQLYLGVRSENASRISKSWKQKDLLESLISAGAIKQSLGWEKSHADTVAWSRRHAWKGFANWQTRKSSNDTESPHLVWMISNSKMKNWRQLRIIKRLFANRPENACILHASAGLTFNGL